MILEIFDLNWFEQHFLYFAGVVGIFIIYFGVKILRKINKDIKDIDKRSKNSMIDYVRKTSKYNKDNKTKKLSFDEED